MALTACLGCSDAAPWRIVLDPSLRPDAIAMLASIHPERCDEPASERFILRRPDGAAAGDALSATDLGPGTHCVRVEVVNGDCQVFARAERTFTTPLASGEPIELAPAALVSAEACGSRCAELECGSGARELVMQARHHVGDRGVLAVAVCDLGLGGGPAVPEVLFAGNLDSENAPDTLRVLEGRDDGSGPTWGAEPVYETAPTLAVSGALECVDTDLDGRSDMVLVGQRDGASHLVILPVTTEVSAPLGTPRDAPCNRNGDYTLSVGRLDDDDIEDVVAGGIEGTAVLFSTHSPEPGLTCTEADDVLSFEASSASAIGVSGAGDVSTVAFRTTSRRVEIYQAAPSSGVFMSVYGRDLDDDVRALHWADIDGDGDQDLVVGGVGFLGAFIAEGGTLSTAVTRTSTDDLASPAGASVCEIRSFDAGDGRRHVVIASRTSCLVLGGYHRVHPSYRYDEGTGRFVPEGAQLPEGTTVFDVAVGSVDGQPVVVFGEGWEVFPNEPAVSIWRLAP